MSNPWLKKNPLKSMWLSSANRAVGTARGQVTSEAKRQVNAAISQALGASAPQVKPMSLKPISNPKREDIR